MTGYTKLFSSIIASTIWREPPETKVVWITMLAMSNRDGLVEASLPGLADLARISIDECKRALETLESPDEFSRTPDNEGRRIQRVDGGWVILNHKKYREKMNLDERRSYLAQKQRESRSRRSSTIQSTPVNNSQSESTTSTHTESESDTEALKNNSSDGAEPLRKKTRRVQLTTAEFVAALKSNPAYTGIDIDREIAKMQAWLSVNPGRQLTQRFAVNWLNKADRSIAPAQRQKLSPGGKW